MPARRRDSSPIQFAPVVIEAFRCDPPPSRLDVAIHFGVRRKVVFVSLVLRNLAPDV